MTRNFVLLASMAVCSSVSLNHRPNNPLNDTRIFDAIVVASEAYAISPTLLLRIGTVESDLNADVAPHLNANGTTDYGAFQINSSSWTRYCLPYLVSTSVDANALCAARILSLVRADRPRSPRWHLYYFSTNPVLQQVYAARLYRARGKNARWLLTLPPSPSALAKD